MITDGGAVRFKLAGCALIVTLAVVAIIARGPVSIRAAGWASTVALAADVAMMVGEGASN